MDDESSLRDIAVAGLAAENLSGDVWNEMAKWVAARSDKSDDELKIIMMNMEREFKSDYNMSAMPTSYRSAKSVALMARKNGVMLLEPTGEVCGKSAVEQANRAVRSVAKAVKGTTAGKASLKNLDDVIKSLWVDVVVNGHRPALVAGAINNLNDIINKLEA